MIIERDPNAIQKHPRAVLTVGTYDGVHVGHQAILKYLLDRTQYHQGHSVVITFDPHPREVVANKETPLLTTIDERAFILEQLGIDRLIVIPFTQAFANLSPEAFVIDYLVQKIGVREIVIGHDHGFGKGRAGDHQVLEHLGKIHDFEVDVIPAQVLGEVVVSSTEIRNALVQDGSVRKARQLLGHPYQLSGTVIHGDARGRTIGFPTANLTVSHERKVIPKQGVYAVQVHVPGYTEKVGGMMNIGYRPTFDGASLRLEVHLLGWDSDLYGQQLQIEFVERIRDEQKFDSIDALIEQLSQDKVRSTALLNQG